MELVPCLLAGTSTMDNVFWIKRSFTDMYSGDSDDTPKLAGNYVDLIGDRINEPIQKRLQVRLTLKVPVTTFDELGHF